MFVARVASIYVQITLVKIKRVYEYILKMRSFISNVFVILDVI